MQNKIIYKHLIICISFFLFSLHVFSQIDKKAFKIVQIDSTENYYIIFLSLSPNSVEINNIPFLLNKGNNHYDVINYNRGFIYCLLSPKIKTFSKNIYTNKVIELSLKCSSNETMTESYMHIGYGDYLLQYPNDKLYFSEQILDLLYTQNLDSIKYFSLIRYQNEFFDMNMLYIWMNFSKTKLSYSKWLNDQIKKAKQYNIKNYSTPIFLYSDMDCQTPYEKTQSISFIDGEHLIVKLFYQYKKNGFVQITFENQIIYAWIKNIKQYICFNNPNNFNDPSGDTVKYNSFSDRVIVGLSSLTNSGFRQNFKDLKNSNETYVFKNNDKGDNSFTTDGNKLYINYSSTEKTRTEGQTIFSNLRHEITHGVQFEHGETGFKNTPKGWSAILYDIFDELEAHDAQNTSNFQWSSKPDGSREAWKTKTEVEKLDILKNTYPEIGTTYQSNPYNEKRKDNRLFVLPCRDRGLSNKYMNIMMMEDTISCRPLLPFYIKQFMKNGKIYSYAIYSSWEDIENEIIDSINLVRNDYIRIGKNKWINKKIDVFQYEKNIDSVFVVSKITKKKKTEWFNENNKKWFNADFECNNKRSWEYYPNGNVKVYGLLPFVGDFFRKYTIKSNKKRYNKLKELFQQCVFIE